MSNSVRINQVIGESIGTIPFVSPNLNLNESLDLNWDYTNRWFGVGTSSPTSTLHIKPTIGPNIFQVDTTSFISHFLITDNGDILLNRSQGGKVLMGTTIPVDSTSKVQIISTNGASPLFIDSGNSNRLFRIDEVGRIKIGGDITLGSRYYETINVTDGAIRLDQKTGFGLTHIDGGTISLCSSYPYPSERRSYLDSTVNIMLGLHSLKVSSNLYESHSILFNHYNTNRFSGISGREHLVFYTLGDWDALTNEPILDTIQFTAYMVYNQTSFGGYFNPQSTVHIRSKIGQDPFRVDTDSINELFLIDGINDKIVSNGDIVYNDQNKGSVYKDRVTGDFYRIYFENGILKYEIV